MHLEFDVWNYVNVVAHQKCTNVRYISPKFDHFVCSQKLRIRTSNFRWSQVINAKW